MTITEDLITFLQFSIKFCSEISYTFACSLCNLVKTSLLNNNKMKRRTKETDIRYMGRYTYTVGVKEFD